MKTPLRVRLSFSHLLVLVIGMILAGILTWLAVENLYLSTQKENLLAHFLVSDTLVYGPVMEMLWL